MGCFLFLETDGVLEPQFRFECKTKVIGQTLECEYCHCFPCNDGKYLTYFKATNIGIKVVYVGLGPNENDYGRIGTVEDYKDGDFQVRYLAAKKSRFVPMIQPHETPGLIYFQFKFYCDKEVLDNYCDILDSLEDEENDEVKGSQDPSIDVTNNLPKCPNCLYSPCRNGQFLFQISDVASGMKLKYVGTTSSEMKGSTCVVKSVKPGFLTITGLGSKKNHFLIYSKGDGTGEVQFQYDCFGELDNNGIEFGVCGNCNNNPCLNGKSVTDDNLVLDWSLLSFMIHDNLQISSLTRVKEKETRKGRFGTILPHKNNQVVKILWDHLDCRQYDILHVKKKLPNFEFACDTPCPDLIQPAVKTFFRVTAQWQKSGELFKVLSSDDSEEEEEC